MEEKKYKFKVGDKIAFNYDVDKKFELRVAGINERGFSVKFLKGDETYRRDFEITLFMWNGFGADCVKTKMRLG